MEMPQLPLEAVGAMEALAATLDCNDFDLLLAGDGSGTTYSQPAGWACVAFDRVKAQVTLHAASQSCGTNNFAELAPFVQALWHHHQDSGPVVKPPLKVTIVSDSELTVRCGNRQYHRSANGCLWAGIAWFEQHGYELTWKHIRRNTNAWATWLDELAKIGRCLMEEMLKIAPSSPTGVLIGTEIANNTPPG